MRSAVRIDELANRPIPRRQRVRITIAMIKKTIESEKPQPRRGLAATAIVLLGLAIALNWRNYQRQRAPAPLPRPTEQMTSRPLAAPSINLKDKTRFTRLTPKQTGVHFSHPVIADHKMAHLYFSSPASGGTAIGDVNNDGRLDLFIASGPLKNRLYLQNEQPLTFTDVSRAAGIEGGDAWACGATMADVNGDGRLDIYVANYDSPNDLYINQGNGRFQESAGAYGLSLVDACLEGVFSDYDRDGWLDLYLLTYRYENPDGMPFASPEKIVDGKRIMPEPWNRYYRVADDAIGFDIVGRADGLLRNNADGTFSNVSETAGIVGAGHGQSATWWDFDNDGFDDLHVGNDFTDPDRLYHNNGDGTFTDIIRESVPHITLYSMGADFADINGDGLFDLLTADMSSTTHFKQKTTMGSMGDVTSLLANAVPRQYMRNALLLNSGLGRFKEAAFITGLESTDWTWCVMLADWDCDGRQDAFFTNGSVRSFSDSDRAITLSERRGKTEWDLYKDTEPLAESNLVFRNEGDLQFSNQTQNWGLGHVGVSMSAAHGDLDGDGDLDLVVAHLDEPLTIYRNDTTEHERIAIRLHGRGGNRFGIGARVEVHTESGMQAQQVQPSRGFLACNSPVLCFGVGDARSVDVKVFWPGASEDGKFSMDHFQGLKTGNLYELAPGALTAECQRGVRGRTLFTMADAGITSRHQENAYDDYQRQALLPHRMSRLGPGLAAADGDGDGKLDYFIGGASGQPGRIAWSPTDGVAMEFQTDPALALDQDAEDMGTIWIDIDRDGDQDLFVVGGGSEQDADSKVFRPRLYRNLGNRLLESADDVVPDIRVSGGPIAAADFDQDGDVDVFIGGRQIPGKYPLSAKSYLLQNEHGNLIVAESAMNSELAELGMVTGALWSDVDGDQDLDLLVTTEWGPIRCLRNTDGNFSDTTREAGLDGYRGWWTGISATDVDGDGDMDYIATNLGQNTKYHADRDHPIRLFYGDFEGSGQRNVVEAEYEGATLFPVRGKSCSTNAIPSLAEKFPTYREFALASLNDIYTPECLKNAYECGADWLPSSVLINDGDGHFQIRALPAEAQLSPCFGCVIHDWTNDGIDDVLLTQNFFSPQPETGNYDGGLGCLLAGRGDGSFEALPTRQTGIVLPDDATAAILAMLNDDAVPDVLVATNDGPVRQIRSQSGQDDDDGSASPGTLRVTFKGAGSISDIAGTRVQFDSIDGKTQTRELASGSGYLSQQPPVVFFTTQGKPGQVTVRDITGKTSKFRVTAQQESLIVAPDASDDSDDSE